MSFSNIATIIGIAATVIFGAWGVYVTLKRKYPGQITFVRESCIGLFDSIVKNMSDLTVHYKGISVGQGLALLKGSIINTGSKDISHEMVEEKIAISLPEGFRWIAAKIISSSPKVQAIVDVKDKSIIFDTGLFRCKEFVRFEALAEIPIRSQKQKGKEESISKILINSIDITHRISDTNKVEIKELVSSYTYKDSFTYFLTAILAMVIIFLFYFVGIIPFSHSDHINNYAAAYSYTKEDILSHIADMDVDSNSIRILHFYKDGSTIGSESGFVFVRDANDNVYTVDCRPENKKNAIERDTIPYLILALMCCIAIAAILTGTVEFVRYRNLKKLRILLGISD